MNFNLLPRDFEDDLLKFAEETPEGTVIYIKDLESTTARYPDGTSVTEDDEGNLFTHCPDGSYSEYNNTTGELNYVGRDELPEDSLFL